MKKEMSISVKGKNGGSFCFNFIGDTRNIKKWEEEGFEIDEIGGEIPTYFVNTMFEYPYYLWDAVRRKIRCMLG